MIYNKDLFFYILSFLKTFITQNILKKNKVICLEIYFLNLTNKYFNNLIQEYLSHFFNYKNILNENTINSIKTIYWNEIGVIGNQNMLYEIQNFQIVEKYNDIIMNACIHKNIEILKWLKNNNEKLINKNVLIYWACKCGNIEILEWLKTINFDFNLFKKTGLNVALQNEQYHILNWFKINVLLKN